MIGFFLLLCFSPLIDGQESPKVIPFSPVIKPILNGKSSFMCQSLSGTMPLSIEWLKDGKKLTDSSIRIRTNEDSSVLTIDSISTSHSGNYTCKISNRFGSDSYSTELKIEGPPIWNQKPKNIKINQGKSVTVNCSALGNPEPKVQWKRLEGSSWIVINEFKSKYGIIKDTEMIIQETNRKQSGRYGCSISNGIEPSLWTEFDVFVNGKSYEE